jgi:hypothetical protein
MDQDSLLKIRPGFCFIVDYFLFLSRLMRSWAIYIKTHDIEFAASKRRLRLAFCEYRDHPIKDCRTTPQISHHPEGILIQDIDVHHWFFF